MTTNLPEGYSMICDLVQSFTEKPVGRIAVGKDTQKKIISLALDTQLFGISMDDEQVQSEITKCLEKEPPTLWWLSSDLTAEELNT
jgi:hypothetical protein